MTDLLLSTPEAEADRALKAKHRAMWASGDYPSLATDLISPLGPALVAAAGVRTGDRVLDVAAGSGNASIPAALAGATVTATDLTPELLDAGRREAWGHDVDLRWQVADAEALPFDDDAFDTVLSCVGVMFAPHHQVAADELVRVCRPGGTIALLSWTPSGFIGQMFATMKPFAPPPPPGAQPPPLWGDEAHVRDLLGDRVTDVAAVRQSVTVTHFAAPEDFRDYFKATYGPTIAVYRAIADDAEKVEALDRALVDLARRHDRSTGAGAMARPGATGATGPTGATRATGTVMEWEYLLLTARVRAA
jgi:ubiquinone/menaquinone biosynthesis C-methylase UbiE